MCESILFEKENPLGVGGIYIKLCLIASLALAHATSAIDSVRPDAEFPQVRERRRYNSRTAVLFSRRRKRGLCVMHNRVATSHSNRSHEEREDLCACIILERAKEISRGHACDVK